LYDLRCKKLIQHYDAHGEPVTAIDFHPREDKLLSTSLDGKIKIWDTRKAALEYTLYGHNGSTTSGCFSTHGDYFATGGSDSMVMFWKSNLSKN
jgi:centriolar protein POC1